jgi:N-methylhydantoinase B
MNSPFANTAACVNVALLYVSDDRNALNEGSTRAVNILTRKGSIVDCVSPAPVTGCTTLVGSAIIESVLRAVEQAAPDGSLAGFARRFRFVIAGKDRDGNDYIWHYFANRGGAGGNTREDGWTNLGVIHNPGGSPSPSIERTEAGFPFFIESYELRPDSAGAGRRRGGLGGVFKLRYEGEEEAILNAAGEGVVVPPYGVDGGQPGVPHRYTIVRDDAVIPVGTRDTGVRLRHGDVIACESAGGGGYGDPSQREPSLIQRDVAYGYVSRDAAEMAYGPFEPSDGR